MESRKWLLIININAKHTKIHEQPWQGSRADSIRHEHNFEPVIYHNASLIVGRGEFELDNLITADACMQERKGSEECCLKITFPISSV